ncbi:MAG: hypothetical protein NZM37_08515 [Sandaracinaceae bacterium]|nr:hypothetical protein [Sandaracinaceae bacterium]MDW8245644.1 hypothetical protein [Sandaracinaceae bacterium]
MSKTVFFLRKAQPFASAQEAKVEFEEALRAIRTLPPSEYVILVDLREAPGRNDPEFEKAISSSRRAIWAHFKKRATLVRSQVGALQVQRHYREDGIEGEVFTDEKEALGHLMRDG